VSPASVELRLKIYPVVLGAGERLFGETNQQKRLGAQRLVEGGLVEIFAVLDLADPAAEPEALVTGRVLDDSVERDVLAHHDRSHFGSPYCWCGQQCRTAGGSVC
jgi:hypothetical protein